MRKLTGNIVLNFLILGLFVLIWGKKRMAMTISIYWNTGDPFSGGKEKSN